MATPERYWLFKSEPDEFGIDDLAARPRQTEPWTGVRNYQARNFMRDGMQVGDLGFFYHSSCPEPGVVGIVRIASAAYPDPSQFDRRSDYFDAASTREAPRWLCVDVQLVEKLPRPVALDELKSMRELEGMRILARGNRLSITPVSPAHWRAIRARAQRGG